MTALARRARFDFAPNTEPNVIPFIDVLLVLLIIFMVTAPKPTTDLRVDMPSANPGPPMEIQPTIVTVQAAPGGYRLIVGGEETSLADLGVTTLAHVLAADPRLDARSAWAGARIFVRADLDASYQHVVSVVDELQRQQFQQVAIVAQRADAL